VPSRDGGRPRFNGHLERIGSRAVLALHGVDVERPTRHSVRMCGARAPVSLLPAQGFRSVRRYSAGAGGVWSLTKSSGYTHRTYPR
jgi:hypothetical protein